MVDDLEIPETGLRSASGCGQLNTRLTRERTEVGVNEVLLLAVLAVLVGHVDDISFRVRVDGRFRINAK